MGWMFGWHTRKELAEHLLTDDGLTTLKHCWRGNNLWAVHEGRKNDGVPVRFVAVYLCKDGAADGWGYKDLDESCGPYYYSCPISYIDLVEAHEKEHGYGPALYAAEWRAKVRELDWKAKRKLALGQHIKLYDKEYTVTGVLGRRGYLIGNRGMTYRLAQSQIRQVALLPSTIQEH